MVKLVILDVDGVLTDSTKTYDKTGKAIAKAFSDWDFTAIKRFKASGVEVCFLSSDKKINKQVAEKRHIDFFCSRGTDRVIDKASFVEVFEDKYNVSREEMVYVGDDIYDISIMKKVGRAYCPNRSPKSVKEVCSVLERRPGEGVVAELYDLLAESNMFEPASVAHVLSTERSRKRVYDICLYGHLTFDTIITDFRESTSVGSIGNVWNHLKYLNPDLNIKISPSAIGEALIVIDTQKSKRTSSAKLNLQTKSPKIFMSKWNHLLYINELPDLSFIKDIKTGIISADVCKGKKLDANVLEYVDYLFLSNEEYFDDFDALRNTVKKYVILHSKTGAKCGNKDTSFETKAKTVDNVNVLGAGDMFAAFIIERILNGAEDMKDIIQSAHNHLTEFLVKNE